MSEQTIYQALRNGGLSPAGACAMLGNWDAESCLIPSNVEDRCTLGDFDYTYAVDVGTISRYQFKVDAYGYGLAQWTYPTRKEGLYDLAKSKNVSISDEAMQLEFCLMELHADEFINLYKYLCTTDDLPEATKRICAEYERPAVNNFATRINSAQRFFNLLANDEGSFDSPPVETHADETCTVDVRVLHKGCLGRDVFMLQCGLNDMNFTCGVADGDFGVNTKEAVCELQRKYNLTPNGIADKAVWEIILNKG